MKIDILAEETPRSVAEMSTYLFVTLEKTRQNHINDIISIYVTEGDGEVTSLTTGDPTDRSQFAEEVEYMLDEHVDQTAYGFVDVPIMLCYEPGENRTMATDTAATVREAICAWATANEEVCVIAIHLDEKKADTGKRLKPHLHAVYPKREGYSNRLKKWFDSCVLEIGPGGNRRNDMDII